MNFAGIEKIIEKLERFCAYQERCVFEVKLKLLRMEVAPDITQKIIDHLVNEKFIDEARFVELFVRSKVNQKGWGRSKIKMELRKRCINDSLIQEALLLMNSENEEELLTILLRKRNEQYHSLPNQKRKERLVRFGISKGYSLDMIFKVLASLNGDD